MLVLCFISSEPRNMTVLSWFHKSGWEGRTPKRFYLGQRTRFKVRPRRVGCIVQSIRAFALLGESVERFNYTEAWRVQSNSKLEQQGGDDFLVPRQWMREHSGRFYSIAHAWYQEPLENDFFTRRKQRSLGAVDGNAVYQGTA